MCGTIYCPVHKSKIKLAKVIVRWCWRAVSIDTSSRAASAGCGNAKKICLVQVTTYSVKQCLLIAISISDIRVVLNHFLFQGASQMVDNLVVNNKLANIFIFRWVHRRQPKFLSTKQYVNVKTWKSQAIYLWRLQNKPLLANNIISSNGYDWVLQINETIRTLPFDFYAGSSSWLNPRLEQKIIGIIDAKRKWYIYWRHAYITPINLLATFAV